MRPLIPLAASLAVLSLAGACSKSASTGGAEPTSEPALAPAPPPSALTDAQKKAILATLPAAYQGADLDNGQAKAALCKACHTLGKGGETGVGPNLYGVFGRKAGSAPGFTYSDSVKALGVAWDADHINTWITKPSAMAPGTKMTFAGLESPKDRIDVVAYLKVATSEPPK
jgi:cytochrome c